MSAGKAIAVIIIVILIIIAGWYFFIREDSEDEEDFKLETKDIIYYTNFTVENYPRVDGSTSTHPLDVLIACKLLNITHTWEWWYDGTKRLVPNSSEPGKEHIAENISQNVYHYGTHGSYVNLIKNEADLILVARLPSDDELDLAEEQGVELEIKPVALDAFVFVLNINNPVTSLTVKQVQDIYTGNLTNWSTVGGTDSLINAYQRDDNSGSQELMEALVMKDLEMIDAPSMILFGMMGPINRLSEDKDGIGYSVYFFEEFMAPNEQIKLCAINGTMPNYENIKSRKYVYTTEVYVVIRKDASEKSKIYELREWLLSEEGQNVVKESGYVPIG